MAGEAESAGTERIVSDTIGLYQNQTLEEERIQLATAPIKTYEDLTAYLATHGNAAQGSAQDPLSYLPVDQRAQFVAGLRFGRTGLGSFNYSIIESSLTATQAYQLLSLFGVQRVTHKLQGLRRSTALDNKIMTKSVMTSTSSELDYECVQRATCGQKLTFMCMDGC
jgi:hypothetical protein